MKKTMPNNEKSGRVLGRKLAREVSLDDLRSAAGGHQTYPAELDTTDPIGGPGSDFPR